MSSLYHEDEANDDIATEDLMRFKQYYVAQFLMHKILECNQDQYFQYMASRGYKIPLGCDA